MPMKMRKPPKSKDEVCSLCRRINGHARHCPNWQCVSCGMIGGKHRNDCYLIDAMKSQHPSPPHKEPAQAAAPIPPPPNPQHNGVPTFGPVPIKLAWVLKLQQQFDKGEISIPGVTAEDHCRVKESRPYKGTAVEIGCPHRAVLREVEKKTCNACNAHKTNTVVYLCLLHAITHHGNGSPIADLGPLFVDPKAVAKSATITPPASQCPNCLEPIDVGTTHFRDDTFSCDAT